MAGAAGFAQRRHCGQQGVLPLGHGGGEVCDRDPEVADLAADIVDILPDRGQCARLAWHVGKPVFDWADPFRLEDQLAEDERMIRDAARAYAQEKLLPRVIEAYREEKTDPAIFREMGEMGLLGVTIPEEFGGVGASYVAYGLVAREVERVDSGYRSMMSCSPRW
jgi:hypothetical protein